MNPTLSLGTKFLPLSATCFKRKSVTLILSNSDLWLLINRFEIPAIFMSNVNLLQNQNRNTNTNEDIFVGYGELNDDFVFIIGYIKKKRGKNGY